METKRRSLIKAISYRILGTLITCGLVYMITHKGILSLSVGIADSAVKIFAYFFHERIWMIIPYGRIKHPLEHFKLRKALSEKDKKVIQQKLAELGYLESPANLSETAPALETSGFQIAAK